MLLHINQFEKTHTDPDVEFYKNKTWQTLEWDESKYDWLDNLVIADELNDNWGLIYTGVHNENTMRQIKFRGQRVDDGKWAYGYYGYDSYGGVHLIDVIETKPELKQYSVQVNLETVGQYTGLYDKNGVEIYEGDLVRIKGGEEFNGYRELDVKGIVKYSGAAYCVVDERDVHYNLDLCPIDEIEIIRTFTKTLNY